MIRPVSHTPLSLQKLYHQRRWNRTKQAVIAREHGVCQRCHKRITRRFIVHHKQLATMENFFDLDNLMLLCQECHNEVTFHEGVNHTARQPVDLVQKNEDLIPFNSRDPDK